MQGATHTLIAGAGYLLIAPFLPATPLWTPILALPVALFPPPALVTHSLAFGVATLAGLLPDIDHPNASISQWTLGRVAGVRIRPFWVVSKIASLLWGHRGLTHSIYAIGAITLVALLLLLLTGLLPLSVGLVWGFTSHIMGDMCTLSGVALWHPHNPRKLHLLPVPLRFRTGTFPETVIAFAVLAVVVVWMLLLGNLGFFSSITSLAASGFFSF